MLSFWVFKISKVLAGIFPLLQDEFLAFVFVDLDLEFKDMFSDFLMIFLKWASFPLLAILPKHCIYLAITPFNNLQRGLTYSLLLGKKSFSQPLQSPWRGQKIKMIQTYWGAWVAQSAKCPTSTQVMISRFMSSSPVSGSGSVLTAQSLEPASDSVSPSLSAPPLLTLCLSLSPPTHPQSNNTLKN